jgi:hypothetical protein
MTSLTEPVTSQVRADIVDRLWPATPFDYPPADSEDWDAFFVAYQRQCERGVKRGGGQYFWPRTYEEVLVCAKPLLTQKTRSEVMLELQNAMQTRLPTDMNKTAQGTMLSTARLLTMVNVGETGQQRSTQDQMEWSDTESLPQAICSHFKACAGLDPKLVLGPELTAENIDHVATIGVEWTDNLVDHLRLVELGRKVCIFHHVTFLKRMKESPRSVEAIRSVGQELIPS